MTVPELHEPLPRVADERSMLMSFLEYFRSVLLRKVYGLTTEQAQLRLPPSGLHLHGLVRHMAYVENYWFVKAFSGSSEPHPFDDPTDVDRDFHPLESDDLAHDVALLHTSIERSLRIEAEAASLDQIAVLQRDGEPVNLRWIMIHMIEEYARHCGHADFLREAIDGTAGD
jgi:hypothetical protein